MSTRHKKEFPCPGRKFSKNVASEKGPNRNQKSLAQQAIFLGNVLDKYRDSKQSDESAKKAQHKGPSLATSAKKHSFYYQFGAKAQEEEKEAVVHKRINLKIDEANSASGKKKRNIMPKKFKDAGPSRPGVVRIHKRGRKPGLAFQVAPRSPKPHDDTPDFIRKALNLNRKTGAQRFGSPGYSNAQSQDALSPSKKKDTFIKDMKKHGILRAFNDINKFSEYFEHSPSPTRDLVEIASPPPPTQEQLRQMEGSQSADAGVFPFQRRARSHSPIKESIERQMKLKAQDNDITSPERKKQAVIANANFFIGAPESALTGESTNCRDKVKDTEEDLVKGKEVEEWLMGSGDAVTQEDTGKTSHPDMELTKQLSGSITGMLNSHFREEDRDDSYAQKQEESKEDDWMFQQIEKKGETEISEDDMDPFAAIDAKADSVPDDLSIPESDEEFENPSCLNDYIDQMDQWIDEGRSL